MGRGLEEQRKERGVERLLEGLKFNASSLFDAPKEQSHSFNSLNCYSDVIIGFLDKQA